MDQPFFVDADFNEVDLSRHLQNVPAVFVVCGGPSLKNLDLHHLNKRGVFSLAVNNAAAMPEFRPSAFVHADPPLKFHDAIWHDPTIMKLVPKPKLARRGRCVLRHRNVDGTFYKDGTVQDCPNVWGYARRSWFEPDDSFFTEEAAWGNLDAGVRRTGGEKTVCTMLLAIRILYEMGARCVYLLGCDFNMQESEPYAFGQGKSGGGVNENNSQYRVVSSWLDRMSADGVFDRAGLRVFNCNEGSGLRAFPYAPFEKAVGDAVSRIPSTFDLSGWYEKEVEE